LQPKISGVSLVISGAWGAKISYTYTNFNLFFQKFERKKITLGGVQYHWTKLF
jgi:hypothetical protein